MDENVNDSLCVKKKIFTDLIIKIIGFNNVIWIEVLLISLMIIVTENNYKINYTIKTVSHTSLKKFFLHVQIEEKKLRLKLEFWYDKGSLKI